MAIQNSGTITIQDIVDEFGGSTPHSLSEYYRNGANVPGNNTNVPTSGAIDLSDFYGAVNEIVIALTNGSTNLNASTLFGSNYTSSVPKRLTIANGVEIGATSGNNVLTIPSGMAGTLIIDNAGTISGYGGPVGQAGGNGILVEVNGVTINNSGTIRAGGGSGGTGGTGGTGGNGTSTSEGSFTGTGTGSCSGQFNESWYGVNWARGGECGMPTSGWGYGYQACNAAFGSQYNGAGGSGNQGFNFQGGSSWGNVSYNWGRTAYSPKWWNWFSWWRFDGQGCSISTTTSTSGGAGGAGGAGGVGQGYNQSAGSGSGGSGGSAGGTNAGAGGTGGTGGTGGAYGATGSTGATGSSGANGNASNGSGGSSGSGGNAAGYYVYEVGSTSVTINNTGTLTGQAP